MTHAKVILTFAITVIVVASSLALSYAWSIRINGDITEKPKREAQPLEFKPLESRFVLSASVNLLAVQDELNRSIPSKIPIPRGEKGGCLKKNVLGVAVSVGCRWWGHIRIRDNITITGTDDHIDFTVPVHASLTAQTRGIQIQETIATDFSLLATARPVLTEDWNLDLNIRSDFRWDKRPTLKLFNIVPVTIGDLVEPKIRTQLTQAEAKIENQIQKLDIKGQVANAWESLYRPIKLSNSPDVWLKMIPKSIQLSKISIQNNTLTTQVSFATLIETTIGVKPTPVEKAALPKLNLTSPKTPHFSIRLPLLITYKTLAEQAEKQLKKGEKWAPIADKPDFFLTISRITIYPSQENLVIGITFMADLPNRWFDAEGTVYFSGKPLIDNQQRLLRIEALRYTRITNNSLVNLVSVLFERRIRDDLAEALIFKFDDTYNSLIRKANKELTRDMGKGIKSSGALYSINVDALRTTDQGVFISLVSEGVFRLSVGM